jgi:azurin
MFVNRSTTLNHRWVLIDGGDQEATPIVAGAATQSDYEPPSAVTVIAKTALLPPSRGQILEFTVNPGSYIYVCTVPGHYQAGMKGSLFLTE